MTRDNALIQIGRMHEQIRQLEQELRDGPSNSHPVESWDTGQVTRPLSPSQPPQVSSQGFVPQPGPQAHGTSRSAEQQIEFPSEEFPELESERTHLQNRFQQTSITLFVEDPSIIDETDTSVSNIATKLIEDDTRTIVLPTNEEYRIVSEHDLVRQVANENESLDEELLNKAPQLSTAATFYDLVSIFATEEPDSIVVVDGEEDLVGVINKSNLLRFFARALDFPELAQAIRMSKDTEDNESTDIDK